MSKAFTRENDGGDSDEPDDEIAPDEQIAVKNYMTPAGFAALEAEYQQLNRDERPKIVEIVSWAAGNGDRSENGDYIYGKKRLREIDRRLRYLIKRLESAEVIDPKDQQKLTRVFFGATVAYAREDGSEYRVQLVGTDEADLAHGKISWISPVAKALMRAEAGDTVEVRTPAGREALEILSVSYPL